MQEAIAVSNFVVLCYSADSIATDFAEPVSATVEPILVDVFQGVLAVPSSN